MPPSGLRTAFEQTTYWVDAPDGRLHWRIGAVAPVLDPLLSGFATDCWAFVTAWNPGARQIELRMNKERHAQLVARVASRRLIGLPAGSRADAGDWPEEPGLFIPGMPAPDAVALGRLFGQIAIVAGSSGSAPILFFC